MPFFSFLPRAAPLRPKRASVLREAVAASSPSVRPSVRPIDIGDPSLARSLAGGRKGGRNREFTRVESSNKESGRRTTEDAFAVVFFSIEDSFSLPG